jgi:hypothetical protein
MESVYQCQALLNSLDRASVDHVLSVTFQSSSWWVSHCHCMLLQSHTSERAALSRLSSVNSRRSSYSEGRHLLGGAFCGGRRRSSRVTADTPHALDRGPGAGPCHWCSGGARFRSRSAPSAAAVALELPQP